MSSDVSERPARTPTPTRTRTRTHHREGLVGNPWTVNADPTRLPFGWEQDPFLAEDVYRRIDAMTARGESTAYIAEYLGCSSRAVTRHRARKGALPKMNNRSQAKLTPEDVTRMRDLHDEGVARDQLAIEFNVHLTTVRNVINRTTWKDID